MSDTNKNETQKSETKKSETATGLILFGHGARDARWAEPFHRLRDMIVSDQPRLRVATAFLELMEPSLEQVIDEWVDEGILEVTVVPVFLGQGGHVRRDLPQLIENLREDYPSVQLVLKPAIGEDNAVLKAISEYCVRQLPNHEI